MVIETKLCVDSFSHFMALLHTAAYVVVENDHFYAENCYSLVLSPFSNYLGLIYL